MKLNIDFIRKLNKSAIVQHKNFSYVLDTTLAHIQYGCDGRVLMIIGPTGVGKTTLMRFCAYKLTEYVKNNPDCGYSPPIILEARAPENSYFNWKIFYIEALRRMVEPAIERKINVERAIAQLKAGLRPVESYNRLSLGDLRSLFEARIAELRPIAVFIDEIQSLGVCKTTLKKTSNLDVVKSLSNSKTTTYILLGTYEARDMLYLGGQLSRRVEIIHFERYRNSSEDFTNAFNHLIDKLSLPLAKDIRESITYIYNHTLGCIGILISWISKALEITLKRGLTETTRKEFEATRLTNIQLRSIAREIFVFEEQHSEITQFDPDEVAEELRNVWTPPTSTHIDGKRKPGKRNPYRDPVGIERSAS